MKNKEQLIKFFEFLNKTKNKKYPFLWTAINFPEKFNAADFLKNKNIRSIA